MYIGRCCMEPGVGLDNPFVSLLTQIFCESEILHISIIHLQAEATNCNLLILKVHPSDNNAGQGRH